MQKDKVLLYGSNGYTGKLIARYAKDYQLHPILSGRNEKEISTLATELNLPYKVLSLDDAAQLKEALKEVAVVIHAAGPFRYTAKQMVEACIETGTHYIDINGDISVFEFIKKYDAKAKQANVMLMPGAGFDVVPTDCMAVHLKNKMPDATNLEIAFVSLGGSQISHGTATTMADKVGEGSVVRENGKFVSKPLGHQGKWIEINGKKLFVMTIPWGDISTAYTSTGIPNIVTYTGMKPSAHRILKFQFLFNWLLRTKFVRAQIQKKIKSRPAGPTDEQRAKSKTYIWGKVSNAEGKEISSSMEVLEGYTLTAFASLIITQKILKGNFKPGYQTPAGCYGEDLVFEMNGCKRIH
jgi:short subunit dehydrogenase-like uncharacterized protein